MFHHLSMYRKSSKSISSIGTINLHPQVQTLSILRFQLIDGATMWKETMIHAVDSNERTAWILKFVMVLFKHAANIKINHVQTHVYQYQYIYIYFNNIHELGCLHKQSCNECRNSRWYTNTIYIVKKAVILRIAISIFGALPKHCSSG